MVLLRTIYGGAVMAFIKVQKLVLDEGGKVTSGSAAVVKTVYDSTYGGKSRHWVRECLGKIVTLYAERKKYCSFLPSAAWSITIAYRTVSKRWAAKIQGLENLDCLQIL